MFMLDPPYALWSIWKELGYLHRGVVLLLAAVSLYSLFSTVRSLLRLRSVWNLPNENIAVIREAVATAVRSQSNLQQVTRTVFYLFGVVLFLGLQTVGQTFGDTNLSLERLLGDLVLHFAFAANVFLIFLGLHLFQWSVLGVLNSLPARLMTRDSVATVTSADE